MQYLPATKLKTITCNFSAVGRYTIFNSSIKIEKDLLIVNKSGDPMKITLGFDDHDYLIQLTIPFSKSLR